MTRLALAHYALIAALGAAVLATEARPSGPEPFLGELLVVPENDPRLLPTGTGAGAGILTPTPLPPNGCTWGGWCDDQPGVETIPAVPVPPALWMMIAALAALRMMKG